MRSQAGHTIAGRWDYMVRSYRGADFMCETVHRGLPSLMMELRAIADCGRTAKVWDETGVELQPDQVASVRDTGVLPT